MTTLRPFLSFYGAKWRDTPKNYPPPQHRTIVEPFAGSAGYSIRHADHNVVLYEIDPTIAAVWEYLIHVKASEVRAIPDIPLDGSVEDLGVCQEAKWLVGFWLNAANPYACKTPSKWMKDGKHVGQFWGQRIRERLASQVDRIRHWKIYNSTYEDCDLRGEATWFVDPPYQGVGRYYCFGSKGLDFSALARWCRKRLGQTIVCENEGATWLPFKPLARVKTARTNRRSSEVVWLQTIPGGNE